MQIRFPEVVGNTDYKNVHIFRPITAQLHNFDQLGWRCESFGPSVFKTKVDLAPVYHNMHVAKICYL